MTSTHEKVVQLFAGLSDTSIREHCIAALRAWHSQRPGVEQFSIHGDLAQALVPMLEKRDGAPQGCPVGAVDTAILNQMHEPWLAGLVEFVDWFIRAGFGLELAQSSPCGFPIRLHLTKQGVRFLDAAGDHPLLPLYVERLATRCPGLPDDVIALLSDTTTCLDHMLLRPAVAVMGVAYEAAVEAVVDALVKKGSLTQDVLDFAAAKRISRIRTDVAEKLPQSTPAQQDHRYAVLQAYVFADQLRRRRNDAAHTRPKYGFDDVEEIEEFLVSAGRHLPKLWSLAL
jgi:hypothetical protein